MTSKAVSGQGTLTGVYHIVDDVHYANQPHTLVSIHYTNQHTVILSSSLFAFIFRQEWSLSLMLFLSGQ